MKIAVIIVTHNAEHYLYNCLASVLRSDIPLTIFVYDNHSTDGTSAIVEQFSSTNKNLIYLQGNKNIGFGAANNLMLRRAHNEGFEYFFLLNQDVYIQPDTITVLIQQFCLSKNIGILSPLHKNGAGTAFDINFARYMQQTADNEFVSDLYFNRLANLYFVPFINAACWLLPRKTLETVGGFDPLFFHYGEDENYCKRVLFHRLRIAVTTATFVQHDRDDRKGQLRSEFDHTKQERTWLLKLSDVNQNNGLNEQSGHLKESVKIALYHIITGKLLTLGTAIKALQKRRKKIEQIKRHRAVNRTAGMQWL